jgi:hypothetical protein
MSFTVQEARAAFFMLLPYPLHVGGPENLKQELLAKQRGA